MADKSLRALLSRLFARYGDSDEPSEEGPIERIVHAGQAEKAAFDSGLPGHRGGPADRVRHRQWHVGMTNEGLVPTGSKLANAGGALAVGTALEAAEVGGALFKGLATGRYENMKKQLRESASDMQSNFDGIRIALKGGSKEDQTKAVILGAVAQAVKDGTMTPEAAREYLTKKGYQP